MSPTEHNEWSDIDVSHRLTYQNGRQQAEVEAGNSGEARMGRTSAGKHTFELQLTLQSKIRAFVSTL